MSPLCGNEDKISPVLLELNGLTTVLLPQDQSFQLLMELLRFNFQKKENGKLFD